MANSKALNMIGNELVIHTLRRAYHALPYTNSYVHVGVACEGDVIMTAEQEQALGPGSPLIPTQVCEVCGGSGVVFKVD